MEVHFFSEQLLAEWAESGEEEAPSQTASVEDVTARSDSGRRDPHVVQTHGAHRVLQLTRRRHLERSNQRPLLREGRYTVVVYPLRRYAQVVVPEEN